MKKVGLILGKFYPMHFGHINMIMEARLYTDELHLFICSESERDGELYQHSAFTTKPTIEDRLNWAITLFCDFPSIHIHHINEDGLPPYPHGWKEWSQRVLQILAEYSIKPTHIFSSEPQDTIFYETLFALPVQLMDPERHQFFVSATKIRQAPHHYWSFIPAIIRPFFTQYIGYSDDNHVYELVKMLSCSYGIPMLKPNKIAQNCAEKYAFVPLHEDAIIPFKRLFIGKHNADALKVLHKIEDKNGFIVPKEDKLINLYPAAKQFITELLSQ